MCVTYIYIQLYFTVCVQDGVRAEDIALAQGNTELADFLSKLSAVSIGLERLISS